MASKLSDKQLAVLLRMNERGGDLAWALEPWATSSTLGALRRRGLITYVGTCYTITPAGREALANAKEAQS
jgi:DNA-binding PadR family transcriptional regulator